MNDDSRSATSPPPSANQPFLLFIVGSTAAGKTAFALQAAKIIEQTLQTKCEIINSDSVQVYQSVNIGTAKPTTQELVQVPHHLISTVPENETYTAGLYRKEANKIIEDGAARGVGCFLVVGGSGFYVQALEKGMFDIDEIPEETRAQLDREAQEPDAFKRLILELHEKDPVYAAKIAPQDRYRIMRALEIIRGLGLKMSEVQERFTQNQSDLRLANTIRKIGLTVSDRGLLKERVEDRARQMLNAGWVDEVQALRSRGLKDWSPLLSVGYREVQAFLDQTLTEPQMFEKIVTSTMQLAKRQLTWFKRDSQTMWCESEPAFTSAHRTLEKILKEVGQERRP